MKTNIGIAELGNGFSVHFIYIPDGFKCKKYTLENHSVAFIGRLNSFNRIKNLSAWRKNNEDLVSIFTNALKVNGWDFDEFPNPMAYLVHFNEKYLRKS